MLFEAQLSNTLSTGIYWHYHKQRTPKGLRGEEFRKEKTERVNEAEKDKEIKRRKEYIECVNLVRKQ